MAGEPTITIIGNLAADPELKFGQSGTAFCNFTVISTPRTFNRQTNQWNDGTPTSLRGTVFGQYAENVASTLKKGNQVIVTGNLTTEVYQKDGENRYVNRLSNVEIGPCLRFATGSVQRVTSGSNGGAQRQQAPARQESAGSDWGSGSDNYDWGSGSDDAPF